MTETTFRPSYDHGLRRYGRAVGPAASAEVQTARRFIARGIERYRSWLEDCREWHEQGYRPHYCEHGLDLWTDYDPICGPCEDGYTSSRGIWADALGEGYRFSKDLDGIIAAGLAARSLDVEFDPKPWTDALRSKYGL